MNLKALVNDQKKEREAAADAAKSKYVDPRFVLSSAAVVERLWSKAESLLANKRRGSTAPIVLEAILFLKENRHLWNDRLVLSAVRKAKEDMKQRTLERIQQDEDEEDAAAPAAAAAASNSVEE